MPGLPPRSVRDRLHCRSPACLAAGLLALSLTACAGPGAPVPGADAYIPTRAQFDQLFPNRIAFYTYEGFVQAVRATPGFAATGTPHLRRREMAAFLAQVAHESDGLRAVREYDTTQHDRYCRSSDDDPCASGRQYYGRGPFQLSWNFNYRAAGQAIGVDLWADPDRVATDPTVAWQTALWYWMTQSGPAPRSAHEALIAGMGFGETIRAINGVLECGQPAGSLAARKVERRIAFYRQVAALLDVAPGPDLGC